MDVPTTATTVAASLP